MSIHLLEPEVIAKIAAGEVIERPASAVKELVENSLDAGARSISVELTGGGCDLIRVSDDGWGIEGRDLPLAVERHATSKIWTAEDLSHVATLGFRGEAVASIAAVSELSILSRTPTERAAHELCVAGGEVGSVTPAARSQGTTVSVERLFFNVPARRKFLKSASAEASQVAQIITQFALAYPSVAFSLVVDGRQTLRTPGSGELLDAAVAVLGQDVAAALVPVEAMVEADRPVVARAAAISGYVADPKVSRSTRSSVWLFVNGRPIRSRSLSHAVEDGFSTLLQVGRYPIALLHMEVPATEVDVNVHPSKTEVRLLRERLIYAGLRDAVHSAVSSGSGWAKEVSVDARSVFGQDEEWSTPRLVDAPIAGPRPEEMMVGGRRLPILRVIGQIAQTYIVAEGEGGLFLIDQHAAHERILLERLTRAIEVEENSQLSLDPLPLELSPAEAHVLSDSLQHLESLGYRLEPFGESSVLIRGVPLGLPEAKAVEALKQTLGELTTEDPGPDWREKLAISLSCRSAVKAGQTLAPEEMRSLVMALEEMDITQHCSHGRPTAILLSRTQLEKEFGRR